MAKMLIKICGIKSVEAVDWVASSGATHIGFVHFPKSPRHLQLADMTPLVAHARSLGLITVAVVVNPDDGLIHALKNGPRPDFIQLHGTESLERVRDLTGQDIKIIKALGVSEAADLGPAADFADLGCQILLDAKPPKNADMPGGLGHTFDHHILANLPATISHDSNGPETTGPYFLSGGLDAQNVAKALEISGARGVDVSSGVESFAGVKDRAAIYNFVAAVKACA